MAKALITFGVNLDTTALRGRAIFEVPASRSAARA
jgi:hypothetical protein